MGFNITTDEYGAIVYRSDRFGFPQYSVAIQKKEKKEYITEYQTVRFRRGVELENRSKIHIHKAFPVLDTWEKDGQERKKIVWMITDFTYDTSQSYQDQTRSAAQYRQEQVTVPAQQNSYYDSQMGFDDLPDAFEATEDEVPF